MKWCEVFQCWCDEADEVVPDDALEYCVGLTCDDCEAAVDVRERSKP